jgi:hypothetical protein
MSSMKSSGSSYPSWSPCKGLTLNEPLQGLQDGYEDPLDFIEDIETAVERDYARQDEESVETCTGSGCEDLMLDDDAFCLRFFPFDGEANGVVERGGHPDCAKLSDEAHRAAAKKELEGAVIEGSPSLHVQQRLPRELGSQVPL